MSPSNGPENSGARPSDSAPKDAALRDDAAQDTGLLGRLRQAAAQMFATDTDRPVWVWNAQGTNLVWANGDGLAALEIAAEQMGEVTPTAPAQRSLQGVARTQASDRGRIEILRVSAGSHQETLVATCKPLVLHDTILVVALGSKSSARRAPSVGVASLEPDVATPDAAPLPATAADLPVEDLPVEVVRHAAAIAPPSAPANAPASAPPSGNGFVFNPRSRPHRFSFKVDAQGAIFDLSSGLADAVGQDSALVDGALASEALAARIGDLPPAVFHGIDERHRFSEHEVLWPVSDTNMAVPVRLSGFDEDDDTLRVFGTALTGKAQERSAANTEPVAGHITEPVTEDVSIPATVEQRAPIQALTVASLNDASAMTAGLFSQEPVASEDLEEKVLAENDLAENDLAEKELADRELVEPVSTAIQVPGGAALAAAASAIAGGFATAMARPSPTPAVAALDDALEDGEAQTAGLWTSEPAAQEPVLHAPVINAPVVNALNDRLEGDEAERAGLWSRTPVSVSDAPADVFAQPDNAVSGDTGPSDAVSDGSDQTDTTPDQSYPAETLDAMKAVATGITAGLAGKAIAGVVPNERAESTKPSTSPTETPSPTSDTGEGLGEGQGEGLAQGPNEDDLSRPERLTFQEIARRLGARITGQEDDEDDEDDEGDQDQPERSDVLRLASSHSGETEADGPDTGADGAGLLGAGAAGALAAGAAGLIGARDSGSSEPGESNSGQVLPFSRTEPNAERMVLDRLPLGIIIYCDDAILYANRAALDMAGLTSLQALKALGGVEALFAEGVGTGQSGPQDTGNGAMTMVQSDGTRLAVTGRLQSVRWDGQSAALLSLREHTAADSEEQEASQDATLLAAGAALVADAPDDQIIAGANAADGALPLVRARIGELEAIIDLASDGVVTLDEQGEIKDLNQAAQALVGYAADDLIGRPFRLLFPEDNRQTALDYLDDMTKQGRLSLFNEGRELECITAQGGLVPVFMTLGRLTDDEPAVYCAVLRDLSPFKQAETDLVEARKAAEEASAHKSDFLARVSHEIRTPLNAVIGFSEVMLEERFGPVGSERYRQYLRDIHTSGEHLMSLLNDLLDLSKIEAGKMELSFGEVDLNDVVQQCLAIMQPQANQGRIIVRTSLPLSLPRVVADIRSVRQVVLNLMSNAIKFTDPGGQIIVSTLYEPSGEVSLRVRDTGRGMDAADVELALEPFRQVPTTLNQVITGTGLGLPLTKALVEANRAQFGLESTPGEGTLAMMTFPSQRVLAE